MSPNKHEFKLTDHFLEQFKGKQPDWGPLGYITYKRTYAREILEEGRTEEYWETIRRVVEGCYNVQLDHCKNLKLPWDAHKAQKSAQTMFQLMWDFKFLPPGRGLWVMGTELIKLRGSAGLQNCAFVSTKDLKHNFAEPFVFLGDMSMLGVGVAFDTKGAGQVTFQEPKQGTHIHVVDDSKEGWIEAIEVVLEAYIGKQKMPKEFDYSQIRPEGEPIKTFGGIAPGPKPLIDCVETLKTLLAKRAGYKISSGDITDIMNIIGRCVVSGGVRRTAELALGDIDDKDYLELKDPEKYKEENLGWRWASNNSVSAHVGSDYTETAAQTAKNGEPGFVWVENCQKYGRLLDGVTWADRKVLGTNPCGEQSLESFELCNLVETFPSRHDSYEDYQLTLKYAYLYAKTVTLIPTHNERTNAIMLRNRRIGLSQSGIVESFEKHGRREHFRWCDEGYQYVTQLDRKYAQWLCIPESIKKTTVKPSGTVSLLPGVTPGIHYPHSEYYFRTIRLTKTSPLYTPLKKAGYRIEESVAGDNSWVVYFPVKEENFDRAKDKVSVWEQVENVVQMQTYWSDNQVSATVTFNKDEAGELKNVLELNETKLKSISFLPLTDHQYEQAPYQEITEEEYKKASAKLKPIDFSKVEDTHDSDEKFCDGESCTLPK